jgi:arylsulfatase A-like enzyme
MKNALYYLSILCCISSLNVFAQQKSFTHTRPNIVFILADDMGYNDLGCYENKYVQTPNIDGLAKDGWKFTQGYVNAPNCAPSRACLLSGMFTPRHGIYTVGNSTRGETKDRKLIPVENKTVLDTSFVTFAEGLTKCNYECISIGKWHLGDGVFSPLGQGFQQNIGGSDAGGVSNHFSPFNLPGLDGQPVDKFLADALTDKAVSYIATKHSRPFCLYLPYYSVHSPVQAPDSLVKKYKKLLPDNASISAVYAAMIENIDTNVGRVIKEINKAGLSDNTIIIFLSDNGPVLNYTTVNLRGEKGSLYEGGIREPLIIKWANHLKPGRVIEQPVMAADFYPTFMELAGLPKTAWPKNLDGSSLLPLFAGGQLPAERLMVWHFPAYLERNNKKNLLQIWRETPASAIRFGDWKLIKHYGNHKTELFNIVADAKETNNLYAAKPEKAKQLEKMLEDYLKKTNAFIPAILNPAYIPTASNDLDN